MFRPATSDDLVALCDLERAANLVALGHVFPPDRYPFPENAVLARWALVLEEPGVEVWVVEAAGDGQGGLAVFAAWDERTLRHLAVHPDRWGEGLASAAVQLALAGIRERGSTDASLWCLEENHRARRVYEHLGWSATSDRQEAEWPPYPTEMRYVARPPDA